MKKTTSILLCAMIILAACANAGGGTESPQSASSQSGTEAVAESTAAGGSTGQENADAEGEALYEESEGGFISDDTAGETAAGDRSDDAAGETAAVDRSDDAAGETVSTDQDDADSAEGESENNFGLVILEEDEGDYRSAAGKRSAQGGDPAASLLHAVTGTEDDAKTGNGGGNPEKEYTVMVYIVGSNLESRYGAATNDMEEMRAAGLDFDRTNLLVYTGGSKRWVSNIPNTSNNVLDMSVDTRSQTDRIMAQTDSSADMGLPETLAEFINYCTTNYPARHYGLILWDHGGGPLWGYGSDELFKNDSLLLGELRSAMNSTIFGPGSATPDGGRKLDWVGFDACLMGTLENAKLWGDYADYLVGSEELEPGRGWDYTFLNVLNSEEDAGEVVSAIVDAYGSYYENNRTQFFDPDVTLAAMDLSKTDDVLRAFDALLSAMGRGIGEGQYALLNRARSRTKTFGLSAADTKEEAYDLVDLRDLAGQAAELYPEEAQALSEAVDAMVIRSASNVEAAGGVSCYMPGDNRDLYEVAGELYAQEEMLSDAYQAFVESYTGSWLASSRTDWTFDKLKEQGGEVTLALTPDQVQNASEIYYSILFRNRYGGYAMTTCNVRIFPDENNVLHIPADPMLMTAGTDLQESTRPWACVQISDSGGESVYKTVRTILSTGHEFTDFDLSTDEEVSVTLRNKAGERDAAIQDIISSAGSAMHSGKGSIDISDYKSIIDIGGDTLSPVRDERGRMKPYPEWEYKGYLFLPLSVDNSLRFYFRPASEFDLDFICQVTVRDVNGNLHGSEYLDLNPMKKTQIVEQQTQNGTLSFEVFEDHAEVKKYSGEDTSLTVPDNAGGKPVTAIARNAFYPAQSLESIELPDTITEISSGAFSDTTRLRKIRLSESLETIGLYAFKGSGIEEIEIPESVTKIGRAAFEQSGLRTVKLPDSLEMVGPDAFGICPNLTEIVISENNAHYKTPDGVLYTADGLTLVQYPGGKGDEYTIEDGTETIGYGAFAASGIRRVEFPQSLRTIENDAFFECFALEELELPDDLAYIGNLAFGMGRKTEKNADAEILRARTHFDSVRIGPNVSRIGYDAFTALDIAAFEVDEANSTYASSGGFITNSAGDMINTVPTGTGQNIVVPDGITTFQNGLFATLGEDTHFYIPDSVFRFSESVFPQGTATSSSTGQREKAYFCTLHCSKGSAAEQYAIRYGIAYDNETDPEEMDYETAAEEKEYGTLYWRVFKNRAELCGFVGRENHEADVLEIPAQYEGLPVTALRWDEENADTHYESLISGISIPETVTSIDSSFLVKYWNLSEIRIAEDNPAYTCDENVVFSKDMKTLVFCPGKMKSAEYVVPEGVEKLADRAFYLNRSIEKVTMPSSLREIGVQCFATCLNLREIVLNKGLKKIDDGAFYYTKPENVKIPSSVEWIGSSAFTLHDQFGEIVLPDKLQRIGYEAFAAGYNETFTQEVIRIPAKLELNLKFLGRVRFDRFEVDPKSEYYTEKDGLLMSRDEKTLVRVPTLMDGELHIPDGTLYIDYYALDECDRITDIYLPDSLLDIGNMGVKDRTTGEYMYVIHCRRGSEPQKKLDAQQIPWVETE